MNQQRGMVTGSTTVSTTYKGDVVAENNTDQELALLPFEGDNPATITIKIGRTVNLGDYSAARADVSISMPVTATHEACEAAYERGLRWVTGKLNAVLKREAEAFHRAQGGKPFGG